VASGEYKKIWPSSFANVYSLPEPQNIIINSTNTGSATSTVGAWVAASIYSNPFLLVELDDPANITGVMTQGIPNAAGTVTDYVQKYCIFANNGIAWMTPKNLDVDEWEVWDGTTCIEFSGDLLAEDDTHEFDESILAYSVKIVFKDWTTDASPVRTQLGILKEASECKEEKEDCGCCEEEEEEEPCYYKPKCYHKPKCYYKPKCSCYKPKCSCYKPKKRCSCYSKPKNNFFSSGCW
jgi:hypothetical protein